MLRTYESALADIVGVSGALLFANLYVKARMMALGSKKEIPDCDILCSAGVLQSEFPEMTYRQIDYALDKLVNNRFIVIKKPNMKEMDSTRFCQITPSAAALVSQADWRFVL